MASTLRAGTPKPLWAPSFMAAWLLTLMLLVAPPELQAGELPSVAASRYADIAEDVAAVVTEAPPLFGGPRGRERTAVLLLAVAWCESAWRADVDAGETRGDHGRSWSLWQIQGHGALRDRRTAARLALEMMRRSQTACAGPVPLMLRAYASGSCDAGADASRARVTLAQRWYARLQP